MKIDTIFKQIKKYNKSNIKKQNINHSFNFFNGREGRILNEKGDISLIIVHGTYNLFLDNRNLKLTTGNIVLLKNYDDVKYKIEDEGSELFIMTFRKEFFDTHFISSMADCPILYDFIRLEAKGVEYLVFDISLEEPVKLYLKVLVYEAIDINDHNEKLTKSALILFLTKLHHGHQKSLIISESSMMKEYDIGKWLRYMADNYSTVTLTSMAEHFNFNPTYFSVRFKTLAKCQFSEKLLEIKLEKAKWLLVTTELSVQDIVEIIGFKEKSYFYRVFKRKYSMTPLQYRKNSQKIRK